MDGTDPDAKIGADATASATSTASTLEPSDAPDRDQARLALPPIDRERYDVVGEHGRGGIGVVYEATDRSLGRTVAIKEMSAPTTSAHARFVREALITARLDHPGVVPVYEAGVWPDGRPLYTMKMVQGQSLKQVLAETTTLGARLALLPNVAAIADAVAYAHSKGIIHRDLKPSNVMVGEFGETMVIDWGLAKDLRTGDVDAPPTEEPTGGPALTRSGAVIGTPAYMPPEQARGEPVDARADVYALGAILYHVLSGRPPYDGRSSEAVLEQVVREAPRPVTEVASVRAELAAIVGKAMSRSPSQRYADAGALREDLTRYQTGQLVRAHRYSRPRRWLRAVRRLGWRGIAAVVVIAGVVAISKWALDRRDRAQKVAACEARADDIHADWNDDTRAAVRAAFLASDAPYRASVVAKILPWLDRQTQSWSEATNTACRKATIDREWSDTTSQKAQWCLKERRLQLVARLRELGAYDEKTLERAVVDRALRAVTNLSPTATCLDDISLQAMPASPFADDASRSADALAVRKILADAESLDATGQADKALARADEAVQRADELGWEPLHAAALSQRGRYLEHTGAYADAEQAATDAYVMAARSGSWDVAAAAASQLVNVVGDRLSRPAEGELWAQHAEVAIAMAGDPLGLREAARSNSLGNLYDIKGQYELAQATYEKVLAIELATLGPDHPGVGGTLNNVGLMHRKLGDLDAAESHFQRALAIFESSMGADHPHLAPAINNLSYIYELRGELDKAAESYERSRKLAADSLGADHPDVAFSLHSLGRLHAEMGKHAKAIDYLNQALAIRVDKLGGEHPYVGTTVLELGASYRATGEGEKGAELAAKALAIWEKALGPDHLHVAYALTHLGQSLVGLKRWEEARPHLERAVAMRSAEGVEPELLARSRFTLAQALAEGANADRERALELFRLAEETYVSYPSMADVLQRMRDWRAEHL